jgi:antitoxin StbD
MNISDILRIKTTVCITELRRNPGEIIKIVENLPTVILSRSKPKAYLLPAKSYKALLDLIDDVSLIKTIKTRKSGKTIKVKI